jgi:hypothetical protein
MACEISRQPVTAQAWVQLQASPLWIWGGQSGIETGFSPGILVFPCRYLST